jgi:U3 small nucleolar RNA-associated protein 10
MLYCTKKSFIYLEEDGSVHPHKHYFFLKILERVTELIRSEAIQKNLLASVVLCLAELVSALRAHAIGTLNQFMPAVIKVLHAQKELET